MAARNQQDWAPAFLNALADTDMVAEACKAAGIHRSTAYYRRARDAEFARAWAEIEEASTEGLERIAVRRATEGSDVLLIFLLKARRPEVYRDHHRVEHTSPGRGALDMEFRLDARAREAIARVLKGQRSEPIRNWQCVFLRHISRLPDLASEVTSRPGAHRSDKARERQRETTRRLARPAGG